MHPRYLSLVFALAAAACADDVVEPAGATSSTSAGAGAGAGGSAPGKPLRALVDIELLDGYSLGERMQVPHFDFTALSSSFFYTEAGDVPIAQRHFVGVAPVGQAVLELLPALGSPSYFLTRVYLDGPDTLDASLWIGRPKNEAPPDKSVRASITGISRTDAATPMAFDSVADTKSERTDGDITWTRHAAALPGDLVGWGWLFVEHEGADHVFLNGASVVPGSAAKNAMAARPIRAGERTALRRASESSKTNGTLAPGRGKPLRKGLVPALVGRSG